MPRRLSERRTGANKRPRLARAVEYVARIAGRFVAPFRCGPMSETCQHCGALRFPSEKRNCCHNGKVTLPDTDPYPAPLHDLLLGMNE